MQYKYTKTVTSARGDLPFRVIPFPSALRCTEGMDVYDIRRANFRRLLDQLGGNRERMADVMGWRSVNLVARYLSEKPGTMKTVGPGLARRLEAKFGKPPGWLDSMHISPRAFAFALQYDLIPEEQRQTVDGVLTLAMPMLEAPIPLPPPAPPAVMPKTRKK